MTAEAALLALGELCGVSQPLPQPAESPGITAGGSTGQHRAKTPWIRATRIRVRPLSYYEAWDRTQACRKTNGQRSYQLTMTAARTQQQRASTLKPPVAMRFPQSAYVAVITGRTNVPARRASPDGRLANLQPSYGPRRQLRNAPLERMPGRCQRCASPITSAVEPKNEQSGEGPPTDPKG
jgi:hypothetical protein